MRSRPKREPPTIDLEATEVSSDDQERCRRIVRSTVDRPIRARGIEAVPRLSPVRTRRPPRPVSPMDRRADLRRRRRGAGDRRRLDAGLAGGSAGRARRLPRSSMPPLSTVSPPVSPGLETKISKPVTPATDPAAAARTEAWKNRSRRLRGELAAMRTQGEKLASAVNEVKSAPRGDGAASPDLSAIDERIAEDREPDPGAGRRDRAARQQACRQQGADAKPADDLPLRRLVAAALLDVLVRSGDPYPAALAAAKSLAPNPDALKPLDEFAAKGVPSAGKPQPRTAGIGAEIVAGGASSPCHDRLGHRRATAGGCRKAGQDRTHRYRRQ